MHVDSGECCAVIDCKKVFSQAPLGWRCRQPATVHYFLSSSAGAAYRWRREEPSLSRLYLVAPARLRAAVQNDKSPGLSHYDGGKARKIRAIGFPPQAGNPNSDDRGVLPAGEWRLGERPNLHTCNYGEESSCNRMSFINS